MRQTAILFLISCLLVSTLQLDASSIPCNTLYYEEGYTITTTPGAGANDITFTKATLSTNGQNYDTYSGSWVATATKQISFSVTGYSAVATKTYLFGLRATKDVTFSTAQSGAILYQKYQPSLGYIAAIAFKGSVSTIVVKMVANAASTNSDLNEVGVTFARVYPPDSTFSCKESCSSALSAVTFDGTQYPGAFCGSGAAAIPTFNFDSKPSNNGLGMLLEHALNPCSGNPYTNLSAPANASWSITLSNNDGGNVAALTTEANGDRKYYSTVWSSVDVDDQFEFEVVVPFDASASESTKNNQSYILGFKTSKNITLTVKTPDTATLTTTEVENIMITQTFNQTTAEYNNNTFITFRAHAVRLATNDKLVITARSRSKNYGANPAAAWATVPIKFYLGQYYPPHLDLTCAKPCNQTLSAFVLFGQRFVGAICWESNTSFVLALLLVLAFFL